MDESVPIRTGLVSDPADRAGLVALSGLPGLTPRRFWELVADVSPAEAWKRIRSGAATVGVRQDQADRWQAYGQRVEPASMLESHLRAGVGCLVFGEVDYPIRLDDPEPPVVIYSRGPRRLVAEPSVAPVAIVGTRRATRYGREVATELAAGLASRGVDVVSGLAHGIDAAAHRGVSRVSSARMVGVVAGGVDVVYPRGNADLWQQAVEHGVLFSEWPCGSACTRWRFPARNRLIAALASVVVVVESGARGGSMYTVDEGLVRDRIVVAVPGPIRSAASAGTNRLIADGAEVLVSIDDFIDSIAPAVDPAAGGEQLSLAIEDPGPRSWLVELIGWEPMGLDAIAAASGRTAGEVLVEVERMIAAGSVARRGAMVERSAGGGR